MAEPARTVAGYETVQSVSDWTRDDAEDADPRPGTFEPGRHPQNGIGLHPRPMSLDENDGIDIGCIDAARRSQAPALRRLERGETEVSIGIPVDHELYGGVAQGANAVEEQDGMIW